MEFRKTKTGYLKLGVIFTIFSIIPYIIITMVGGPLVFAGLLFGGLTGIGLAALFLIGFVFFIQGWFVFWFYERNKFTRGRSI